MKREIRFQFDYDCAPIWLTSEGDYLISAEGSFESTFFDLGGRPEERLKGEYELERCVRLIFEIYCRIWNINNFGTYDDPYIGFEDEQEKTEFFDACDYVIKRMKEIFGDEFSVNEYDARVVDERAFECRKR